MARPAKFRLAPDDVLDPPNARKLAGHVSEIEFFRKEVEKLQAQIAGVYDAADEEGFEKKFIRKVVAIRAKDETVAQAEKAGIDAYTEALEIGFRSRARVENPDHDPITGEIHEPQPTMAAQTAGSETAVANSTPGSGAGTVDAGEANWPSEMTTASPANEPETIPSAADPTVVVSEAGDDRSTGTASATVVAFRINPKTHFANSKGLPRLHGCLKPEACGGSHRSLCFGCSVQHDGPAHQEGAA